MLSTETYHCGTYLFTAIHEIKQDYKGSQSYADGKSISIKYVLTDENVLLLYIEIKSTKSTDKNVF